ncbi:MAG: hypothetical protein WAL50_18125 [Kineosporiaceae bacterium]
MSDLSQIWPLLALLLVLGWYLTYSASRLDRLHHKVTSTRAALDVQLVRRSAAAVETARYLDPATALLVTDAAARALSAGERDLAARAERDPLDVPAYLEPAENDLSRALQAAFPSPLPPSGLAGLDVEPFAADALEVLSQACIRVQLARRFYNDAVAQVQRVRRKRVVRWAHLAGRAPLPQMVEIDDALPTGLGR